jgi:hypothetical protein
MLPKLQSAAAIPAYASTHRALSTVSGYDPLLSLIHWLLDFALAPLFPLASCQEIFIRLPLSPDFWLVLTDFFVVQSIHIQQFNSEYDLIVLLKFQTVRYIS